MRTREYVRNFKAIVKSLGDSDWYDQEAEYGADEGYQSCYIGSVFRWAPSGKYYMPWTTNQTESDVDKDERFWEAVETWLSARGMWTESSEGDPCDIFVCRHKPDHLLDDDQPDEE